MNDKNKQLQRHQAILKATEWGTSSSAVPMSQIALNMLKGGVQRKLVLKSQIIQDLTFLEAVEEGLIILGLDSEDYSPYLHDKENEVELILW